LDDYAESQAQLNRARKDAARWRGEAESAREEVEAEAEAAEFGGRRMEALEAEVIPIFIFIFIFI